MSFDLTLNMLLMTVPLKSRRHFRHGETTGPSVRGWQNHMYNDVYCWPKYAQFHVQSDKNVQVYAMSGHSTVSYSKISSKCAALGMRHHVAADGSAPPWRRGICAHNGVFHISISIYKSISYI